MMSKQYLMFFLFLSLSMPDRANADKLGIDDRVGLWPRASTAEKVDFATRMGRAFSSLSPDLDRNYFMKCLEETANIGNPGDIRLEEAVKLCVAVKKDAAE